jgi:hypothetical protein
LVIVPRGSTEVNGSTRDDSETGRLQSSPLSQTNWDNRIVFPLEFTPVGQACPIGAPERRMIGHELVVDAITAGSRRCAPAAARCTATRSWATT